MAENAEPIIDYRSAHIPAGEVMLEGTLNLPQQALAVVLFAHGSGSGRHSPRNRHVANVLNEARLATLLIDLLTREEEEFDLFTGELRFNIALLAHRLVVTTEWLTQYTDTRRLPIGYFGASTRAAGALVAAAQRPDRAQWYRAADVPIWPEPHCRACAPRRCLSSEGTTSRSSSSTRKRCDSFAAKRTSSLSRERAIYSKSLERSMKWPGGLVVPAALDPADATRRPHGKRCSR
jgi:hypothetical protein